MKQAFFRRWNLLDLFLLLLVLLAVLAIYFNFINPIQYSHLIKREGVSRYAEVGILLPDDLRWMKDVLPEGEASRNVYGELDWQVSGFEEEILEGEKFTKLTARILIVEESSGLLRYGKYTLVKGGKIFLINDNYFLEGRIYNYRLLEEKVRI